MDRMELLSFLAGEELRERELVKRWSSGGEECSHLVAHHTLRAERFGAVRRELSVPHVRGGLVVPLPMPVKPRWWRWWQ